MQTITLTIEPADAGKKLRSILKGRLGFSSHAIAGLTRTEHGIELNGQRAFTTAVLQAGDVLTVDASDRRETRAEIIAGNWPLEVVWEDEWLLIANKPAGMASLATSYRPDMPTVAGALAWQYGTKRQFHIVNRLDKGTTGLFVVAKCGYVHNLLRERLHTDAFYREYWGICHGCPSPRAGTVALPIGRDESSGIARKICPHGAPAVTHYEVLETNGELSLLKLTPETGRTHQLRLHMSAIGYPLAGDWLYGTEEPSLIDRPALHSYLLRLCHPVTGEPLKLTAPLPEDMARLENAMKSV